MSGGGQRQTSSSQTSDRSRTNQSRTPLPAAGREYERALREAGRLYQQGIGYNPFPGATYAPMVRNQARAANLMGRMARNDPFPRQMQRAITGGMRRGGMSQPLLRSMRPLQGIAKGKTAINTAPLYRKFMADFQPGMDAASQYLTPFARGDYAKVTDEPILGAVIGNTARDMSEAAGARFAAMGRFASPDMSQTIAQQVGDVSSQMRLEALMAERARQLQAAGMLDESALGFGNMRLGAIGGISDIQAQNIQNQMGASGMQINAYNAGLDRAQRYASMLPTAQTMRYAPAEAMYRAGALQQGDLQNQINANIAQFNTAQQAPWNRLNAYTSAIYGNPISGFGNLAQNTVGSGSTTNYQPYSPVTGGIMGALGGAGMMAQAFPATSPYATSAPIVGGLMGGLGGLMG